MASNPSQESLHGATRELLLHALYEAAELEHNLMCTYLYAAFSLKSGVEEGLNPREAAAVARWRREILAVAVDEMSHLTAVWNITSALGGVPHYGRTNFPLDPGYLPAGVVVKLASFNDAVLQHFIYLERPMGSDEPDGKGFAPERLFARGTTGTRLTPMGIDYATVGEFYGAIGEGLRSLVQRSGESATFCGDPALQLSEREIELAGARRVICLKTALAAFDSIVRQGEGAPTIRWVLISTGFPRSAPNTASSWRQTRVSRRVTRPPAIRCCAGRRDRRAGCGSSQSLRSPRWIWRMRRMG